MILQCFHMTYTSLEVYGAAVTFYELYDKTESLSAGQRKALGLHLMKQRLVHVNKAVCVLSKKPFFSAFKKFLMYIHRLCMSSEPSSLPIERLVYKYNIP